MKNLIFCFFTTITIFSQNELTSTINNYLDDNMSRYLFLDSDIDEFTINNEINSESMDMKILYINQTHNGLKIHNAISTISIKDNEVFHYANNFISNIDEKINSTEPLISPKQAIISTVNQFDLGQLENLEEISNTNKNFIFNSAGVSQHEIPVNLGYFLSDENSIKLVWDLSIHSTNGKFWYSVRVDALTGIIIDKSDWIINCNFEPSNSIASNKIFESSNQTNNKSILNDGAQYNVFALPAESPIHGPRQLLLEPSNDLASPYGWHDTDGAEGPEYTITRGNNVWAREDIDGQGGQGYSPDGTSELNFDFELNFEQQPIGYQDASLTNLFYTNNMMHDIWYQYGFDEESGNFQENNYGNSSSPLGSGDSVTADGQDGDGMNNASFGTPPDGGNPTMTMYLWNGPSGEPLSINNGNMAGSYAARPAGFGNDLPSQDPLTADLALVTDEPVIGGDSYDACQNITNGSEIAGKIAVIRRGTCEFGFKILAAQAQGAVGVIMVNNVPGDAITMGEGADDASNTPPSVMVTQEIGDALINELLAGETISASLLLDTYNLDGSFDNGIVAHEYGHGISNRLTAGASSTSCLQNAEQMGEGWSDWFGLMITMEEGDQSTDPRGIGNFASGRAADGNGIRNAPYSTDLSINNFTYNDSNNEAAVSQPHGVGFVFATMLWDLTWAYIDKYGFDPDLFNGNGGNNKVMQLVLDGLKLQPCSPGFIDGRDAILAADMASTGGQNQCLIWEVFANRGLGFNASQGDSGDRTDQVEDFNLPPDEDPTLENCEVLSIENITNLASVYPNPSNGLVSVSSQYINGETTVQLIDINGRQVFKGNYNFENKINLNFENISSGIYILKLNNNNIFYNYKLILK
ncbi:T9SS-dependent M36 family metallopeptidase [Flavobacteriaceae bacterium]|nr:T9SS-dependent M36 family metallopeptidase [Flavobacteriaceae bacterium]MDC1310428.1 T9SS-dependent M36 family metallopeptidase [Flavobacteriaceae bacterium]